MGGEPALVAVDGGNSKTDVIVAGADGTVLGWARGAGSNHQLLGVDGAMAAIDRTIAAACDTAGLPPSARHAAAAGAYCLAGVDLPVDERAVREAVAARRWSATDLVENDTFALWRAGTDADWGLGVVCGTGLNCAGRGPDGSTVRFPSLGELSGDLAAGGAWLGMRGLGLALRAGDGRGARTALVEAVPAHFGLADPEAVLEAVYTGALGFDRLFELARVVLDAAASGDVVARQAADQLADEVVAMAGAAIRRLEVTRLAVEVVLGGGIFDSGDPAFLSRVETGILATAPKAVVHVLDTRPVVGAALLALDLLRGGNGRRSRAEADAARRRLRQAFGG